MYGLLVVGLVVGMACSTRGVFECRQADQCALRGQTGVYEANGYCSFPDDSCPSDSRYGELAPQDIAGTCVPQPSSTGSAGSDAGVMTNEASSAGSTSSGGPVVDTGDDTTIGVSGPSSSTGSVGSSDSGGVAQVVVYTAVVSGCNDAVNLDPLMCEAIASPREGAMIVDGAAAGFGPYNSYVGFDLDASVAADQVVAVTLRLYVTDSADAESSSSGEVYAVEPFTHGDLFMVQPQTVGPLLAPDQGGVTTGQAVDWPLPVSVVVDGGPSVYLGVLAIENDGIDYWSDAGAQPPQLLVELQP